MKFLKKKQIDTAEVQQDIFTGNGSDTEFTLTFTVVDQKQLFVSIDGLTQEPTAAYGINTAGTKVVFTESPPIGSKILVKYIEASPINITTVSANTIGIDELNVTDGTVGQALTTNGAGGLSFTSFDPGGFDYKSDTDSPFTAYAGQSVQVDTTNGQVTMTLPASPNQNDTIRVVDAGGHFQDYPLTVDRNGSTIMDVADDLVVNTKVLNFGLVYNGSTWRVFG
tara:strand:- start:5580 stop:6251 length:672 start_codon:yes stop_codon:yes gene_type:complete